MAQARRSSLALLLAALALASFAAAAVTITNITEWHVQSAGTPPVVKVAGADVDGTLLSISTQTADDGTNRTIITIKGYTGDPTKYDEVIKICNKDTAKSYAVSLVYQGVISGDWTYVKYLKLWLGTAGPLNIDSGTPTGTSVGPVTVGPGSCVPVAAEVLIDANTPSSMWYTDLVSIRVDVVSTTPP
jgi:hypothetical protein